MEKLVKESIKELYKMYGFDFLEEKEGIISFAYKFGVFSNAEIVVIDDSIKDSFIEDVAGDYEAGGYRTAIFRCNDYEKIHMHLFNSFFSVNQSRKRLNEEYLLFCEKQKENLHNDYRYIASKNEEGGAYGDDCVTRIVNSIDKQHPILSIIEAAAGYGKTCTAFEIIRVMLTRNEKEMPLLIELSKNRNARIFKYVLQDEINQKFSQLSYELVLYEIKNGLIPLVIDGFDELIEPASREGKFMEDVDEQSVTMLTTIADILGTESKAKVVLTSRRSAMFTGDTFNEWVGSKLSKDCEIERYQIPTPNIIDWIGKEKYSVLGTNNNIANINNPVMLTFIANNITLEELQTGGVTWESLLDKYFRLLLEREQDRQELLLEYHEIYDIMEDLAGEFAKYDITSEKIEFIQELLKEITERNILEYRDRYKIINYGGESGILTKDEYIKRLSHNSLLDRHISKNKISFINEFILGILVGDAICDKKIVVKDISSKFADFAITAYAIKSEDSRKKLYDLLSNELSGWGTAIRFRAETKLLCVLSGTYSKEYLYGMTVSKNIQVESRFVECTFENCIFEHCRVNAKFFESCMFFNCKFYDVEIINQFDIDTVFANCLGTEDFPVETVVKNHLDVDINEKTVLEQFWKTGYASAEPRRTYTALFRGIPADKRSSIKEAIESLKRRELIIELNVCYSLNFAKIDEIERILGRR